MQICKKREIQRSQPLTDNQQPLTDNQQPLTDNQQPTTDNDGLRLMSTGYIRTFEDLECWKACRKLRIYIAKKVVPVLPREERFRLGSQLLSFGPATSNEQPAINIDKRRLW